MRYKNGIKRLSSIDFEPLENHATLFLISLKFMNTKITKTEKVRGYKAELNALQMEKQKGLRFNVEFPKVARC